MIVSHRVSVAAPARTVAAALAEPWLLRTALGLDAPANGHAHGQLFAGQEVVAGRGPVRLRLRVDVADEGGLVLNGPVSGLAALVEDAEDAEAADESCATTLSGTLRAPGLARRRADALVDGLADAVRQRAAQLVEAPVVVGAAIVDEQRRVLVQQRDRPVADAGRWEFPGGRVEPGESEQAAVARECVEELGVRIGVGGRLGPDLVLANGWVLRVYTAELVDGRPRAKEHRAVRWVTAGQLDDLDWLPADRVLVPRLRRLLG